MYSDKEPINILTSLLVAHGVTKAVVCPGSRNAPIVHNLSECGAIACYPVTDERSAGFYALGMAQQNKGRVAVCVTSGTALLNLAPAVAEAYYQRVPLVIVSADRPKAWINQQDGQTLPQADALGPLVKKAVSLPEGRDETERWHCNRLVNEALLALDHHGAGPVHINVPLSEPLFRFNVETPPAQRIIRRLVPRSVDSADIQPLLTGFAQARRPLIVIGQLPEGALPADCIGRLASRAAVISEVLSYAGGIQNTDDLIASLPNADTLLPDFILHLGGMLIGKNLKAFLRRASKAEQWLANATGEVCDTFMHLTGMVESVPTTVLRCCLETLPKEEAEEYATLWNNASQTLQQQREQEELPFSEAAVVKHFEAQLTRASFPFRVHYANSLSVRLANRYAHHHIGCNRGVNGIEGSLSTAAGMSVGESGKVFCVIGDLSFFYDQNALWNRNLRGNFRILLLNNGGGGIFQQVQGMPSDALHRRLVCAEHTTHAEGICRQNDVHYLSACTTDEMKAGIDWLLNAESERPILLECNLIPNQ